MATTAPLNIGLIVRRLAYDGGTERYASTLSAWLASQGHKVRVYCAQAEVRPDGVEVMQCLPLKEAEDPSHPEVQSALATVAQGGHDVVECLIRLPGQQILRAGGGAHGAFLNSQAHTSVLDCLKAWAPAQLRATRADRAVLRSADLVVCNSEMAARDVRRHARVPASRLRVVRNGVDLSVFRPETAHRCLARARWSVPAKGRVAIFFASGFTRKGFQTAVEAFDIVGRPVDRLVVMGRDAHAERHMDTAKRRLRRRLVVHGPDPHPERWLPGADASLLPTRYDAAANTTLEAMACGVPPVTSKFDGNAEIVPDQRLVVAKPTNVQAFAEALRLAWEEPTLSQTCRKAAEDWPVSRNGEAMEAIFREFAHG